MASGYTTAQRDALQQALTSGALTVAFQGKSVTYRSIAEIKTALDEVNRGLAGDAGNPVTRQIRIFTGKGI